MNNTINKKWVILLPSWLIIGFILLSKGSLFYTILGFILIILSIVVLVKLNLDRGKNEN